MYHHRARKIKKLEHLNKGLFFGYAYKSNRNGTKFFGFQAISRDVAEKVCLVFLSIEAP